MPGLSQPVDHLLVSRVVALNSSSKIECQLPGTPIGAPEPLEPVELRVLGAGVTGGAGVASERTRCSVTRSRRIPRLAVARIVSMRPRIASSTRTLAWRWRRPVLATRESLPIRTLTTLRLTEPADDRDPHDVYAAAPDVHMAHDRRAAGGGERRARGARQRHADRKEGEHGIGSRARVT